MKRNLEYIAEKCSAPTEKQLFPGHVLLLSGDTELLFFFIVQGKSNEVYAFGALWNKNFVADFQK